MKGALAFLTSLLIPSFSFAGSARLSFCTIQVITHHSSTLIREGLCSSYYHLSSMLSVSKHPNELLFRISCITRSVAKLTLDSLAIFSSLCSLSGLLLQRRCNRSKSKDPTSSIPLPMSAFKSSVSRTSASLVAIRVCFALVDKVQVISLVDRLVSLLARARIL